MANPCGTGKAHIAPGYERATYVGAAAAEALVGLFTEGAGAIVMAPIIAGGTYDLLHICESDPPDDPVLTEQDLVDAVDLTRVVASSLAWQRIKQWFVHVMWPTWCQCDNNTHVPPATSAPLPSANQNPGLPSGGTTSPCWHVDFSDLVAPTAPAAFLDVTLHYLPRTSSRTVTPSQPSSSTGWAIPTGVTQLTVTSMVHDNGQSIAVGASLLVFNATGAQIQNATLWSGTFTGSPFTQTITLAGGAAYWTATQFNDNTVSVGIDAEFTLFCSAAAPNTLQTPCCPPDPLLDQRLTSIIQMLQVVANQQLVGDTQLVESNNHVGLSGAGTINLVNACAAIRVSVTQGLNLHPNNPGSPDYYFSLGFITSIAAGSPLKGWRLVYGHQTFPLAAYADQVGYTLPAGVTVNITELLAG